MASLGIILKSPRVLSTTCRGPEALTKENQCLAQHMNVSRIACTVNISPWVEHDLFKLIKLSRNNNFYAARNVQNNLNYTESEKHKTQQNTRHNNSQKTKHNTTQNTKHNKIQNMKDKTCVFSVKLQLIGLGLVPGKAYH